MKLIKRFDDAIAFSFWGKTTYYPDRRLAIRWQRFRGLFGIKFVRDDYVRDRFSARAIQIGIWWGFEFSLLSVHINSLK